MGAGRLDVMAVVMAVEGGGLCGTLTSMGDRAAVIAISSEWAERVSEGGKDWTEGWSGLIGSFLLLYP